MRAIEVQASIRAYFQALYRAWGAQHWWPAESRFEVVVSAFLTQNTAWRNVELALANLRAAELLSLDAMRGASLAELELAIRPAGFFRQKAQRLRTFIAHLDRNYGGSLERMFARSTEELRDELLELNGVGPETADSILLYAGNREVFVVDAYARRILNRHGLLPKNADYEAIRIVFEKALSLEFSKNALAPPSNSAADSIKSPSVHPPSRISEESRSSRAQVMSEMHALLVGVAKNHCQSRHTSCDSCPLGAFLPTPVTIHVTPKKP